MTADPAATGVERRDYPASSNITSLLYEPETTELTAVFKGNNGYAYVGVEPRIWQQLRDVKGSVGALFAHLVRNGGYAFRKLGDDELAALAIVQVNKSEAEEAPKPEPAPRVKRPRTRTIRKLGV